MAGRNRTRRHKRRAAKALDWRPLLGWFFRSKRGRRVLVGINALITALGVIWFFQQPPERQAEIRVLVANSWDDRKDVRLSDVVLDLWQYYYGEQFVESDFRGRDALIYGGVPSVVSLASTVKVLINSGYVVGYSDSMRSPVWAAYRLFDQKEWPRPEPRPGFRSDRRTFARVRPSDFSNSGYDRGHLAPNYGIALCYGRDAQLETFLMSNVVPQSHALNAGLWRELEWRTAVNYTARCREIWVITGPVFRPQPRQMQGGVPIPDAFYKIFIDETVGKTRVQAFLLPQTVPREAELNDFLTSVDEVEALTGLDFLPALEDSVEEALESRVPSRSW